MENLEGIVTEAELSEKVKAFSDNLNGVLEAYVSDISDVNNIVNTVEALDEKVNNLNDKFIVYETELLDRINKFFKDDKQKITLEEILELEKFINSSVDVLNNLLNEIKIIKNYSNNFDNYDLTTTNKLESNIVQSLDKFNQSLKKLDEHKSTSAKLSSEQIDVEIEKLETEIEKLNEDLKNLTFELSGGISNAKLLYDFLKNESKWTYLDFQNPIYYFRELYNLIRFLKVKLNEVKKSEEAQIREDFGDDYKKQELKKDENLSLTPIQIEVAKYYFTKTDGTGYKELKRFFDNYAPLVEEFAKTINEYNLETNKHKSLSDKLEGLRNRRDEILKYV